MSKVVYVKLKPVAAESVKNAGIRHLTHSHTITLVDTSGKQAF